MDYIMARLLMAMSGILLDTIIILPKGGISIKSYVGLMINLRQRKDNRMKKTFEIEWDNETLPL